MLYTRNQYKIILIVNYNWKNIKKKGKKSDLQQSWKENQEEKEKKKKISK